MRDSGNKIRLIYALPYRAREYEDDNLPPPRFQDVGRVDLPNHAPIQRLYDRHAAASFVRGSFSGIHFYS